MLQESTLLKRPVPRAIKPVKDVNPEAKERAKAYQQKTSSGVGEVMKSQAEYQKMLIEILETISKLTPVAYNQMMDYINNPLANISTQDLQILENILENNQSVGAIEAGTGSGKTHGVLKFILENPELFKRTLIGSPTRAMSLDVKATGNDRVASERMAGHHIGGKDQSDKSIKDIEQGDKVIAMTFGKLFNIIVNEVENTKDGLPLANYDSIIIDEADALDLEMIPLLKWLTKVRPDLKLIFMSATLNYRELKNIFNINDEFVYLAEASERPRPIQTQYATKEQETANDLNVDKPNADNYINTALIEIDDWFVGKPILNSNGEKQLNPKGQIIRNNDRINSDESAIVFMPTVSSINKFADFAKQKYGQVVEVRVVHSQMSTEEMESNLSRESRGVPILFVASDVVGRGKNFADHLNLNYSLFTGFVNRPNYDKHSDRGGMSVTVANSSEEKQANGRPGRNTNDDRDVEAKVLIQQQRLSTEIRKEFTSGDPTQLILKSSKAYNAIKNNKLLQKDLYKDCLPESFVEYLSSLDTNPETSEIYKSKLEKSIAKLTGLGALDSENNLTEFGQFLLNTGFNTDYGIMIYESISTPNFKNIVNFTTLLENEYYITLAGKNENYTEYRQIFTSFKGEFFYEFDKKVGDLDFSYWLINTLSNPPQNNLKGCEKKLLDVYKSGDMSSLGINIRTIDKILNTAEDTTSKLKKDYKRLTYQGSNNNQTQTEQAIPNLLPSIEMKRLALSGFSSSLCIKEGWSFKHIALNDGVIVSKTSLGNSNNKDAQFSVASSFNTDSNTGRVYASGMCALTLEDLMNPELTKYASFNIEVVNNISSFDMQTGTGAINQDIYYENSNQNSSQKIGSLKMELDVDSPDRRKYFLETLLAYPNKYINSHNKNLDNFIKFNQMANLARITEMDESLISVTNLDLMTFYQKQLDNHPNICSLVELEELVKNGKIDFNFNPFDNLNQAQSENLEIIRDEYPDQIGGIDIIYEVNSNNQINALITLKNDSEFIEYYKNGNINLIKDAMQNKEGIEDVSIKYNNQLLSIEEVDNLRTQIETQYKKTLLKNANNEGTLISQNKFSKIITKEELDKIQPVIIGRNPFDDTEILAYPNGQNMFYFEWVLDQTEPFETHTLYKNKIKQFKDNELKEQVQKEFKAKLGTVKARRDKLTELYGDYSSSTLSELNQEINNASHWIEYGERDNAITNIKQANMILDRLERIKYVGENAKVELERFINEEVSKEFQQSYTLYQDNYYTPHDTRVAEIRSDSNDLIAIITLKRDSNNPEQYNLSVESKDAHPAFSELKIIKDEKNAFFERSLKTQREMSIVKNEIVEATFNTSGKKTQAVIDNIKQLLANNFQKPDIHKLESLLKSGFFYSPNYEKGNFSFDSFKDDNGVYQNEIIIYQLKPNSSIKPQGRLKYDINPSNEEVEFIAGGKIGNFKIILIDNCEILEPLPSGHKENVINTIENPAINASSLPSNMQALADRFSKR